MQSVDSKIVERSITKLFDHCIEDPKKKKFSKTVIRELLEKNKKVSYESCISNNFHSKIVTSNGDFRNLIEKSCWQRLYIKT